MSLKIYYLGYYDVVSNAEENRNHVLAASNKMTYIVSALECAGFCVELISASQTLNAQAYSAKTVPFGKKSRLHLFKTLPWGNKLRRVRSVLFSKWQVFWYIWRHVGKGDTLVVYHSLAYVGLVRILKRLKGFRLVLEVEEIYADVTGSDMARKKEYKLFRRADAYIFPTELLNEKLNSEHKPHCIIYGTYQVEENRHYSFNDGKIHVVYAGTFDPRKGGAAAAAAAAEFLPANYHVHILGFGSKTDVDHIRQTVAEISEKSAATVTYDGCLSGEEYIRFIQSCDIGLSTQNPNAAFNDTSFPSKILSYMANGLRVVSVRIPAIERSAIGNLVTYYDTQTPKAIAKAILKVDFEKPYDSRTTIQRLSDQFVMDMKYLLENEKGECENVGNKRNSASL